MEVNTCLLVPEQQKTIFEHPAASWGFKIITGPEENVLKRYENMQREYPADYIIRITSDCALLNPFVAEPIVREVIKLKYDYGHTDTSTMWPDGLDIEIFTPEVLRKLGDYARKNDSKETKEHVTWPIKNDSSFYALKYSHPSDPKYKSVGKLSIDTMEDLERVKTWIEECFWIDV